MTVDAADPALTDDTVVVPRRGRHAALSETDRMDDTVVVGTGRPRPSPTAVPPDSVPVAPPPPAPLRLRLADGAIVPVDGPVVLGRAPRAPRVPAGPEPRLVALPSPLRELSGSHAELRPAGRSVLVTDLRSTNGTVVTVPGAAPRTLAAGESAVVPPGSLVDLGEGNLLALLPAEEAAG